MTLTSEQLNNLATKDDLKNAFKDVVNKAEFNEFKNETQQRFDKIDERFDKVDERFDKVDSRLEKVDSRLDKVEGRLDVVEVKLDRVIVDLIDTKQQVGQIVEKVDALADSMSDMLTAIDGVVHKLDKQEMDFVSNMAAHDRFERRINRVEKHLDLKPI